MSFPNKKLIFHSSLSLPEGIPIQYPLCPHSPRVEQQPASTILSCACQAWVSHIYVHVQIYPRVTGLSYKVLPTEKFRLSILNPYELVQYNLHKP